MSTFIIIPLLYVVVVVFVLMALWRIMKAQEATAVALQQIAHTFSRTGPAA